MLPCHEHFACSVRRTELNKPCGKQEHSHRRGFVCLFTNILKNNVDIRWQFTFSSIFYFFIKIGCLWAWMIKCIKLLSISVWVHHPPLLSEWCGPPLQVWFRQPRRFLSGGASRSRGSVLRERASVFDGIMNENSLLRTQTPEKVTGDGHGKRCSAVVWRVTLANTGYLPTTGQDKPDDDRCGSFVPDIRLLVQRCVRRSWKIWNSDLMTEKEDNVQLNTVLRRHEHGFVSGGVRHIHTCTVCLLSGRWMVIPGWQMSLVLIVVAISM